MGLPTELQTAREIVSFGEEIAMTLIRIGRALFHGRTEEAETILTTRNREMAAGRKAHQASHLAGPRRGK